VRYRPPWRRGWRCVEVAVLAAGLLAASSAGSATLAQATPGTAPKFTSPSHWQYFGGSYGVFVITASGSPTPTFSMSGTLPPGLLFKGTPYGAAVIHGFNEPAVTGQTFTVTITASNGVSPNAVQHLTMIAGTTTTTTSVSSASPNPAVAGHPVTYTAKVAPAPSGGTVYFGATFSLPDGLSGSTSIVGCGSVPVSTATGTATCSSASLLAGSYHVYASYSGYGLYKASTSPSSYRMVVHPRPPAYWLGTTNGRVFGLGTAPSLGHAATSAGRAIAGTAGGKGYYVVGAGGGVFTFGNARFYGSVPGLRKRVSNIVSIAVTSDDRGYYLLGSDGGIFTFGNAKFYGSLPGIGVRTQHVVGMVAYPASTGYLLVSRDGGVFTFGNARFYGSLPGLKIRTTSIRGILPAAAGTGYVLVGSDGGVFNFGTGVKFYGSLPGKKVKVDNIVGIALTQDQDGYWMAGSDGKVYGFGSANVAPTPSGLPVNLPVAAIAGIPPPPPTVPLAQRLFNGIVHFLPSDRFANLVVAPPPADSVSFHCSTCGSQFAGYPFFNNFEITVYPSHSAALTSAIATIVTAQHLGFELSIYAPKYVAGNALLSQAPDRVVKAFGLAIGQPVVTVGLVLG
jgi:Bacterial Ig-like domain (group 3)